MEALTDWGEFILAYAAFLGTHAIPARPKLRNRLIGLLGTGAYLILYSLLSLLILYWLLLAAGRAPHIEIWAPAPWQFWVPLLVMLCVCLLITLSIGRANPFSFGGGTKADFDPQQPGIVGLARHPLLVALALWSFAHMVPNGDLAHLILFGGFALFALAGMAALDRRKQQQMGKVEWQRLWRDVKRHRLAFGQWLLSYKTALRLLAGIALYVAILTSHQWLFGVSPLAL